MLQTTAKLQTQKTKRQKYKQKYFKLLIVM